ncbi:hypothetical protein Pfo_001081 [Paulownia fortunei]|nr:hypothetical protein Pfo_001081 [Paulownia fortunei]
MIPAIAMLLMVLLVCIACCIQMVDNFTRERETAIDDQSTIARIWTLSTTFNTETSPSTGDATGIDDSRIKSCSELVVPDLNENGSIISGLSENYGCPICLEGYGAKEKVRRINLCQHCFHADCIDRWLQKNSTCPICRVSLLDVKL